MKHKKLFITLISILCALIVAATTFFIYVGVYYKATDGAREAAATCESYTVTELKGGDLAFMPSGDVAAGLIFYPGGKVEHTAYAPLMAELASRGVACVLIKMPFRLAVFDSSAADGVREKFPEISEWYIGGHSLGGAISASYVSKHASDYKGLLLLGAYSTADLTSTALVTLSVYGSEDKVLNLDKYEKNRKNLTDLTEHIIPGGCHAYFGAYGPQSGDGSPTITPEEQISITAEAFCAFIAEH